MNKWIKAEDRLPGDDRAVLVWIIKGYVDGDVCGTYCVANYDIREEWRDWITDEDLEDLGYTVVAWQELPDEYKEEQ